MRRAGKVVRPEAIGIQIFLRKKVMSNAFAPPEVFLSSN